MRAVLTMHDLAQLIGTHVKSGESWMVIEDYAFAAFSVVLFGDVTLDDAQRLHTEICHARPAGVRFMLFIVRDPSQFAALDSLYRLSGYDAVFTAVQELKDRSWNL